MFSDESTVRQFHYHHTRVRRPVGQRYNSRYTVATVKHPLSIMFWGSISCQGRGGLLIMPRKTTINAATYLRILQQKLPLFMRMRNCTVFQHDGAPCHTAKIVKTWLASSNITVLAPWPGSSPDLNPIEHCWAMVQRKVADMRPASAAELEEKLKMVWVQQISQAYCCRLIESMPARIQAVIKAKGGPTKY